jgi:replicative DNA helicase
VAYFSLEMTCRELALRLLATETGIPSDRLEKGILSRPQWAALHAAVARLRNIPLYLDDSGTLTLWQLASTVRRLKAQRGLDAVLIDYLQLLHPSESYPNETAALAALSRGLKQLAKELDIPVLVVSQLSREPERRGPAARPQLSDLRGSGSIEQDANAVLFLWSPGLGAAQAANLELIVAKNRNGATGEILLDFRGDTLRFAEVPSP